MTGLDNEESVERGLKGVESGIKISCWWQAAKIMYLSTSYSLRGNPLDWKFIYGVQPQHYKIHVLYSYTEDGGVRYC